MSETPLLQLPLLEAQQAQKHITHNEALLMLDACLHLSVISRSTAEPPEGAADGLRYLVAAAATGSWAGQAGRLAVRQGGGWVFLVPRAGWRLWVEAEKKFLLFDGTQWMDLLAFEQFANLRRVGINAEADDVNRLTVASPAVLFTHAGAGQQVKLNKNAVPDTASLLFQTGWSGRAEMGLAGDDDFRVKVSADGVAWKDAIRIDRATGQVSLPATPAPRMLFNQSLAAQGPGFAVDTYLAGFAIALAQGALQPGTRYRLVFDVAKTAAGTAAPVLTLRFGPAGALSDGAAGSLVFPLQTAAADDGRFTLDVTFRSAGAAAVAQILGALTHTQASSGLATVPGPVRRATSPAFDSTISSAVVGVSVNAGELAQWRVSLVQAQLENLA